MIQSLTSGHRDKKLLQEAQQMLDDSRAKIEFLRMRIMKVRQARQQQHARGDAPPPNGEATSNKGTYLLLTTLAVQAERTNEHMKGEISSREEERRGKSQSPGEKRRSLVRSNTTETSFFIPLFLVFPFRHRYNCERVQTGGFVTSLTLYAVAQIMEAPLKISRLFSR